MIPIAEPSLGEEELKNVVEAVKSSWISSKGKFIDEFEEKFTRYCGGVATSNGTVPLHLALKALGIGKGDEVIIPDLTFVAVANTVIDVRGMFNGEEAKRKGFYYREIIMLKLHKSTKEIS